MKYIITDLGEVKTGGMYHQDMGQECKGKVVSAGHYTMQNGIVEVFGESYGYGIKAKPEDAEILRKYLLLGM